MSIVEPEKCPKCGAMMIIKEFDEVNDNDVTEGVLAEYLAGTIGTMICLECGYSEEFEI
jgi:DNA-directed RNA polymerase subunit M/transcription elongation factor TFIIS